MSALKLEEERTWLEQTFDVGNKLFIGQKHNDVIALFNAQIVISNHDIITANDRANNGAGAV